MGLFRFKEATTLSSQKSRGRSLYRETWSKYNRI